MTVSAKTINSDGVAQSPIPWMAIIVVLTVVFPLGFQLGPLDMSLSRLFFLVTVPILTIKLLQGAYGRITIIDFFVYFHVIWLSVSVFINNPDVAVTFTGSTAIAILGGYLVARASLRTAAQFATFCRFLAIAVIFTLPFAVIEAVSGTASLRDSINSMPFFDVSRRATIEQRMGFYRVQFLFAHPIHYGFFCSLTFSLAYVGLRGMLSPFRRFCNSSAVAVCCFFSFSSGAVLAMAIQGFLMGWQRTTQKLKAPWMLLLSGSAIFYVIVEVASDRPAIIAILSRVSFNPMTVSIRQRLFEFGTEQIAKTPIFGVGYNDWGLPPWMSGSVDNFWLLQALIYGMPSFLALAGAAVGGMILAGRRDFASDERLKNARAAWIFTMIGMSLTLATVAVWGEMHSFVMLILGSGVFLLTVPVNAEETRVQTRVDDNMATSYSRFSRTSNGLKVQHHDATRTATTRTRYTRGTSF